MIKYLYRIERDRFFWEVKSIMSELLSFKSLVFKKYIASSPASKVRRKLRLKFLKLWPHHFYNINP